MDGDPNTTDGTWSASSGKLSCSSVATGLGPPVGTGSIFLISDTHYKNVVLKCTATLDNGCDEVGLVFGYIDDQNFWVKIYRESANYAYTYQVTSGSWISRDIDGVTITDGVPIDMEASAYGAGSYTAGPGRVGVWVSDGTDNEFDDFQVIDVAGPYTVSATYFSQQGGVTVDDSDNNALKMPAGTVLENCVIRRGVRVDKYVATFKFKWNDDTCPGFVVRWLSPREWLVVDLDSYDGSVWLGRRTNSRADTEWVYQSGSTVSLTSGNWYTAKVVVDDDPNNATLQRLRFWIDTDDDGDYSDETTLISDTAYIDANWSAGYVGLYAWWWDTALTQEFDDVVIGLDNNSDGDYVDAGDAIQSRDDFNSSSVTLVYDDNGNLTRDGVFNYVYDAWNRLREVQRYDADDPNDVTTIAEYEYDGKNRRTQKTVTNSGVEAAPNDGGNTTLHYYYGRHH